MQLDHFKIVLSCVNFAIIVGLSIVQIYGTSKLSVIGLPDTEYIGQIRMDWQAVPFTSLSVENVAESGGSGCQSEQEVEVFVRPWFGMNSACDCLDGCYQDEDGALDWCFQMILSDTCSESQLSNGCKYVEAWPLVKQSIFTGLRVCGTTGGSAFLNVTRPDPATQTCPQGTSPCLTTTVANQTVCYKPDEHEAKCPITDLQIVDANVVASYKDQGYTAITFNSTTALVYSKGVPQLPPTTIQIEAQPCMDAFNQSASSQEIVYAPEMMQAGCQTEQFSGLMYDPRYTTSGLYTDLYSVQNENGVLQILSNSPSYDTDGSSEEKKNAKIRSWNRPTLNWSLECEAEGFSREYGFEAAQQKFTNSDLVEQPRRIGIATLSIAGFFFFFPAAMIFSESPLSKTAKAFEWFFLLPMLIVVIVTQSLFYRVIADSKSRNSQGVDLVESLSITASCMDSYTTFDEDQASDELAKQRDTIRILEICFWVVTILFAVQVGALGVRCCCKMRQRPCDYDRSDQSPIERNQSRS